MTEYNKIICLLILLTDYIQNKFIHTDVKHVMGYIEKLILCLK